MNKVEEKELKVLGIDEYDLGNRLKKYNAKKVLDAITEIVSFDVAEPINYELIPNKLVEVVKLAEELTWYGKSLRDQNFHLRARKQSNHYEFTLKFSKNGSTGIKNETELNIDLTQKEWMSIIDMLTKAGLTVSAQQQKKRVSYTLEDEEKEVRFDIDTWPGIPTYVEVEATSSQIIFKWIELLGLSNYQTSTLSGQEFFDLYGVNFYSKLLFTVN